MKRNPILPLLVCLSMLIVVFTPAAGCKSPTVQSTPVNTMFTIGSGVDAGYKAYLDLVISGKVSTNSVPSVSQKYTLFQQAFAAGIEFVSFNSNSVPPISVLNAASEFNNAVSTAKGGQ